MKWQKIFINTKNNMKKIIGKLLCLICIHNQIENDDKGGFWTRPYCIRCGKQLKMPKLFK